MSQVLVVDDNASNRYLLTTLLQGHGHTVEEAVHGAEAILKANQTPPDLIISDLLMPVMDGYTLLRQWRMDQKLHEIPFLVYTATYTDTKDKQLALDLGADAFLVKPAEPDEFMHKIVELLERGPGGHGDTQNLTGQAENVLLKQYNQVLVHKLEDKVRLLEQANATLNAEIEEHRRAREELNRASTLLNAVMQGTTDAVFVKDLEGRYLLCNPAAAGFMGRRPEDIVGHSDEEFFDAESARQVLENDRHVMKTGQVHTREEVLTAAGATRTYLATKGPYRDSEGNIRGVMGISRDITERIRAEHDLREREEMLGLLLDSTAEAIFGTDLNTICTFANQACAKLLGYKDASALIGKDLHAEMHCCEGKGDEAGGGCALLSAARMGQEFHLEYEEFMRADGSKFVAEFFTYPIRHDGELKGAVATLLDVTERRKLEEQLYQAQKMEAIGRLAGGVAHDFNNLISVIIGYTDFALEELPEDEPLYQDIEQVRFAADKAAVLTRQLLVFSRKQILKPEVLLINTVIENCNKLLQRLLGEDIELRFLPAANLGCVRADAGQIEQVILNLAVNARDAMPSGGRITIKTDNVELGDDYVAPDIPLEYGHYVLVSVTDTGSGMNKETLARIFEPFFTTKAPGKGTGLGLATVYGIVEQSGGHIGVYSEPGMGTSFRILLPRVDAQMVAIPPPASTETFGGTETILLVEDDLALREMTQRILERAGYNLVMGMDGIHALETAKAYEQPIDMVLTDVVMPRLSGRELVERLTVERPGIKVLYMSGFADDAIVRHGISHDAIEFIGKPFSALQLTQRVHEVLNKV